MDPSLLVPAGGWHAVHDGALWAPTAVLYKMGPFGPPSCMVPRGATTWRLCMAKKKIGSQLKKKIFFCSKLYCLHWCSRPQKSKVYCNTFHLPPLGELCDHPELSYCPLEKTLQTDDERTDDDDEGAFNIDCIMSNKELQLYGTN